MDYTIHQLKVFIKICACESITKASQELFLTQPAVSIQLKKLQDQFSIPLTEIIGRKLYVTEFGKEIEKSAKNIVAEMEAIEYKANLHKGVLAGKLKISIVSTGKYVMPYFISNFLKKNKGIDLSMDVTNKRQVIHDLENNTVDFALVSVLPDKLELNTLNLLPNQLFLVGKPTGKKANAKKILTEQPLIYREEGSATRVSMENFIKDNNIKSSKKIELTSNEAIKQALIAGMGYSIMPIIGIRNAIKIGDLEIIPFQGLPIITQWNLVWLKTKKISPAAKALIEYINENKNEVIKTNFDFQVD